MINSIPKIFIYVFLLLLANTMACSQNKITDKTLTANPVIVEEDSYGNKTVKDWSQPSKVCENCKSVWIDGNGSKIWFEDIAGKNFDETLDIFAENNDLNNFKVLAKEPLKKTYLLDNEGYGWAVIASATKNTQKYKLAIILVYGSLDESPKTTGIHTYLANEKEFIGSGGWVVPASFWLGIDPTKEAGDLIKQGKKENKTQAKVLAQLSDIWIESIYQAYIIQAELNVKALHNLRISAMAAWDPNAIIISGDNGYNQIEYKND